MPGPLLMEKDREEVENAAKRLQEIAQKIQERIKQREESWQSTAREINVDIMKYSTPTNRIGFGDVLENLFKEKTQLTDEEFDQLVKDLNTVKAYYKKIGEPLGVMEVQKIFNQIENTSVVYDDVKFAQNISEGLMNLSNSVQGKINMSYEEIRKMRIKRIREEVNEEEKAQQRDNEKKYELTKEKFKEGYVISNSDVYSAVSYINLLDASAHQDKYITALKNLGFSEEEIKDLSNRVLSPQDFAKHGIIVYPVRHAALTCYHMNLEIGVVPVLVKVEKKSVGEGEEWTDTPNLSRFGALTPYSPHPSEDRIVIKVANPLNGEMVKVEVSPEEVSSPEKMESVVNSAVKELIDSSKLPPGVYGLTNGTVIEKKGEMNIDDIVAGAAIGTGAVLTSTGVGAPAGIALIYGGTAYLAAESGLELYRQAKTHTFDLASPDTQLELGIMIVSAVPAAKIGVAQLGQALKVSGALSIGTEMGLSVTNMGGMVIMYNGMTAKNAELYAKQVVEGKSTLLPFVYQTALFAGTAVGMYAESKMLIKSYPDFKWHIKSVNRIPKVNNEQLNENAKMFLSDLDPDTEVRYYCFDKRGTQNVNYIGSYEGGDFILKEYRRMFVNIGDDLNKMGYKTMINLQGGDEIYMMTTAPEDVVNEVVAKNEKYFIRTERNMLSSLMRRGVITEETFKKLSGIKIEERAVFKAGDAYRWMMTENVESASITEKGLVGQGGKTGTRGIKEFVAGLNPETQNVKLRLFRDTVAKVFPSDLSPSVKVEPLSSEKVESFIEDAIRQGKNVVKVEFNDVVADPNVKDALLYFAKENGGKTYLRIENGNVVAFSSYNNIGHEVGDLRIYVGDNSIPSELLKMAEVRRISPTEYIIVSEQGTDISKYITQWQQNINNNMRGITTSINVTSISSISEIGNVLSKQISVPEKAALRVLFSFKTTNNPKILDAVEYLKNNGFDLNNMNIPEKLRVDDLPYILNDKGQSIVDVLANYPGVNELVTGDVNGINPLSLVLEEKVNREMLRLSSSTKRTLIAKNIAVKASEASYPSQLQVKTYSLYKLMREMGGRTRVNVK